MPDLRLKIECPEPLRSEVRLGLARIRAWVHGVRGVDLHDEDVLALEQLYQALKAPQ